MIAGEKELELLCARPWTKIKAVRMPNIYFLDIVFETDFSNVIIFGNAYTLDDHTDTFGLAIREHDEDNWWPTQATRSGSGLFSEVRDLTEEWRHCPVRRGAASFNVVYFTIFLSDN